MVRRKSMPKFLEKQGERGQTFMEFLFLLLMLISMSYIMLGSVNRGLASRWTSLIQTISNPTDSPVELR
jgi:hypothetical protein